MAGQESICVLKGWRVELTGADQRVAAEIWLPEKEHTCISVISWWERHPRWFSYRMRVSLGFVGIRSSSQFSTRTSLIERPMRDASIKPSSGLPGIRVCSTGSGDCVCSGRPDWRAGSRVVEC